MNNKRLAINMSANIIAFIVTMGINFLLTPYIINTVGKESYGFVGLANNFVSYAQLVTLALNSMAGRFITIKIHENNEYEANKYFTSVTIANTVLAILMIIPSVLVVIFIDKIVNIPSGIINDIRILWILIFLNFLISIITSTFSIATFVTNRLDLSSIRNIEANILKVVILVFSFTLFKSSVWYIGLASLICTIFIGAYDIYYKNKLIPNIKVKYKYFDFKAIKEIVFSGIWNVVTKLGQILTDGLDLLISNIFIDSYSMGILAIAKTVPTAISNLLVTVTGVFSPNLTIKYAKKDLIGLVNDIKISMKIGAFFTNISISFTMVFGYMFYSLWVPGENIDLIQKASILTMYGLVVGGAINTLFGVFTITNKLKLNSFIILFNGIINTILVFFLLRETNLGILAVAGVSTTTALIKNLTFTPIYSAKCLGVKRKTFYPPIIRSLIAASCTIFIFYIVSLKIKTYTWTIFILCGIICSILGVIINYLIILNKDEKKYIIQSIRQKLKIIINNILRRNV